MPDLTPPASTKTTSWTAVWQLPVLLVGMVLLGVGLYLAKPRYTPPDFHGMLDTVDQYLEADNPEEARIRMDTLVEEGIETQNDLTRGRYYQYLGDHDWLVYSDLYPVPVDTPESAVQLRKVVEAYETAEGFGRTLDGLSMQRWAETLVLRGQEDDALAIVDRMEAKDAAMRYSLIRRLIEKHRSDGDPEAFARMLDRFERTLRDESDKKEQLKQRQWVAQLRARHYLDVEDPQRAIDYINREMQRLRAAGADDAPDLLVLLGQAYQKIADFDNARRLYAVSQQMIQDGNPLNGRILVGLAQIELAVGGEGFEDRAHTLFGRAAKEHPMGEAYIDALIGRAHVEAMMGRVTDSVDHFRLAIAQMLDVTPAWDPRRKEVTEKIASHVDRSIDLEQYDDALDYISLLLPMYDGGKALPAESLFQFAEIHEKIGEARMTRAESMDPLTWAGPGDPPIKARRNAYQEAAHHYGQSAEYFKRHADTVTVIDDEAHGESLWSAGQNYDLAQRWPDAIDIYAEYVTTRPGDGEQLKARHHLAKAYMADRQYESAVGIFKDLIDENPQSNWAYSSLVPMARCYTAMGQSDAAVRVLLSIVDGHPGIRPESDTYREALVDLARTYYLQGQDDPVYFVSAIERLDTAVERYGNTHDGPVLRYMLGDSLRRSSRDLAEQAQNARSERQRLAFQAERNERLRNAEMYYDQVITELEARFAAARSDLENLYLRNAYFYKADCSYDRQDYTVAIDRYREAAQRWSDHPSSLVAQVQMVNAYCELQEFQQAYVANQNALWQLSQMEDEVFDSPDMPMTRQHWEDWLRWSSELKLLDKQSASAQ
ncbi:tetratricopeptide repeat protein [Algisphaera agarilytica]|uniref:Tetratricopeptide (TPR) repeat protein n=1 Tax=Algisphaera agarilytica TaxID=1385975 RepID=A0A7X0LM75_9BACT|nr:tetratricopeptide repeat protein [Algisphaera agarilytica]MBB6430728.1 tetratricopeptide (TPR) repeat protein [Algisphaera agarilytica]